MKARTQSRDGLQANPANPCRIGAAAYARIRAKIERVQSDMVGWEAMATATGFAA